MKSVMTAISSIVFLGVVFLTFYQARQTDQFAWWGESFPTLAFLLTAAIMLVGILFGCLFEQIAGRNDEILLLHELRKVIRTRKFIAALLISPFIFFSVYAVVSRSPGDPASYLLAFQNGFFCEAVFNKIFRDKAPLSVAAPQGETA